MNQIKIKIYIMLILVIGLFYGCATIPGGPGDVSESVSHFDNTKQLSMEPAWLYDSKIKLSLFKTTKMDDNLVVMYVFVEGSRIFSRGKSLKFNVDGKIYAFKSIDDLTDINTSPGIYNNIVYIPPYNWSSKRYIVTKDFIKRLIDARRVWVRVELSKEFVEGEFSSDAFTTARPAFRKFYRSMLGI